MTQEVKDKLERVYEFHAKEGAVIREADSLNAFLTGAQTILDNPQEWGLVESTVMESIAARWNKVAEHNDMRTALHLIQQDVFEALKQQDDEKSI